MRTFSILILSMILVFSYNEHHHKVHAQGQNDYYNRTLKWQAPQNPMNCQEEESFSSCIGKLQDRIASLEAKVNKMEKEKETKAKPSVWDIDPGLSPWITAKSAREK